RVAPDDGRDVYDIASLTKALVTAPLVYRLQLPFSTDLSACSAVSLVPGLTPGLARSLTVGGLLSHTSGLPAWRNLWVNRIADDDEFSTSGLREHLLTGLNRCEN